MEDRVEFGCALVILCTSLYLYVPDGPEAWPMCLTCMLAALLTALFIVCFVRAMMKRQELQEEEETFYFSIGLAPDEIQQMQHRRRVLDRRKQYILGARTA